MLKRKRIDKPSRPIGALDGSVDADGGRTLGASLFSAADLARKDRRHQRRLARGVEVAQRRALLARRRDEIIAVKAEQNAAAYLPRGGESGARGLRSYRRLKVQPHRATTDVLGRAYPFLAEAGLGTDGVFIGSDSWSSAAFVYDPWTLNRPGFPGDSKPWKGWSHGRTELIIEAVPA